MKKGSLLLIFTIFLMSWTSVFATGAQENLVIAMDMGDETLNLNPYTATDSNSIIVLGNLYDGLYSYNPEDSTPDFALAEKADVSTDGLSWTFYLRECKFSNGNQISSQTFLDSWNTLNSTLLSGKISFINRKADGSLDIEIINDRTFKVNLKYPVPYLPSILCQPALGAIDPNNNKNFSGAYTIDSHNENKLYLKANKNYWDKVEEQNIEILLSGNFSEAFNNKTIHWSLAPIENAENSMIVSKLYGSTFFYFNSKGDSNLPEEMKETLLAVLPVDVLRYIQGTLIESCSLVPHSKASAKHEINKLTAFPMISIAVPKGSQNGLTSEVIAEYWSKTFGVTVVLNTVPVTIYSNNPKENPYDFCLITWIADYLDPMAFLELFKSDSSYNLGNYYNSDYDNILEEANRKTGNERLELLEKAETILLEDGTILPLSVALATNFIQKELIEGWFSNPLDIHLFKYIKIARNN